MERIRFSFLFATALAGLLGAQTLRVQLAPESLYVGEAFTLRLQADAKLEDADFAFEPSVRAIQRSSGVSIVNGAVSTSLTFGLLADAPGVYTLRRVAARTADGKTLVSNVSPSVTVRAVVSDPALAFDLSADPVEPMPGDDVTLTLAFSAPQWADGAGKLHSPFLERTFFGDIQERAPQIAFDPGLSEDSPLRLTGRPQLSASTDGTNAVWRIAYPLHAVRAGKQTFPAPTLRDTRITGVSRNGQLQTVRCAAVGAPLTVIVASPPLEGRPATFCGAIGKTFSASAALDSLGVRAGDPVRLTLALRTDGDAASLHAPKLAAPEGFRLAGDPVRTSMEGGADFVYVLRPLVPGLLEIPPLEVAWFDRDARAYRTAETDAIPLRVRPSAQLVLLGDDGETALAALPPALIFEELPEVPPKTPWILFALGVAALSVRLLWSAGRWLGWTLLAPFRARRPLVRALRILAKATRPDEAAEAVRLWAQSPALTAEDLRRRLPDTPEAAEIVRAYAELEGAAYSGGEDLPEARAVLRRLLPKARLLALLLLLCALPLRAAVCVDFVREEAEAVSCAAVTPEEYARAANLWLTLASEELPSPSRPVLLNAATCAFFARRPEVSLALATTCERLYGVSPESEQLLLAACSRLERPMPLAPLRWGRRFWLRALLAAAGLLALACAVPWPRLRRLRFALFAVTLLLAVPAAMAWSAEVVLPESSLEETL